MAQPDPEHTPLDADPRARDRVVIARIAAAERWARTPDRTAATEPARRGLRARFEREADPDGILNAAERARRGDALMTALMLRLARPSAKARRSATERAISASVRIGTGLSGAVALDALGGRPVHFSLDDQPPAGSAHAS